MFSRQTIYLSVAASLIVLIGIRLGLPLWTLIGIAVLFAFVPPILTVSSSLRQMQWIGPFTENTKRIKSGEADAVLREMRERYNQGDRDLTVLVTLSAAYNFLNDAAAATGYAAEARAVVDAENDCTGRSLRARLRCDIVVIAEADALVTEGRFTEAAQTFADRLPNTAQTNFFRALTAWYLFLANEDDRVRELLKRIKPPGGPLDLRRSISTRYMLMLAYMRHNLTDANTNADLHAYSHAYVEWRRELERSAGTPYGERLRPVVEELRVLLDAEESHAAVK